MGGSLVAGCTANGQVKMFSVNSKKEIADMAGHNDDEISRVVFSPCGNRILTASADKTARIWRADDGDLIQTLEGHTDDIFSTAFSYDGKTIITASKDNTCRIWR